MDYMWRGCVLFHVKMPAIYYQSTETRKEVWCTIFCHTMSTYTLPSPHVFIKKWTECWTNILTSNISYVQRRSWWYLTFTQFRSILSSEFVKCEGMTTSTSLIDGIHVWNNFTMILPDLDLDNNMIRKFCQEKKHSIMQPVWPW